MGVKMEARKSPVKRCSSLFTITSLVVYNLRFVVVLSLSMSPACAVRLPIGDDPTADRPVAGLLNSGYSFPKNLYLGVARTSPGSFYYAYIILLECCLVASIIMPWISGKLREYIGSMNTLVLVSAVVYSHFTVSTLSELITAYFIGLCVTQVQIDTVRQVTLTLNRLPVSPGPNSIARAKLFSRKKVLKVVITGTISGIFPLVGLIVFPFSAVLSLTYLDSYNPMDILAATYAEGCFQVIAIVVIFCAFNREHTPSPFASELSRPTPPRTANLEHSPPPYDLSTPTQDAIMVNHEHTPPAYLPRPTPTRIVANREYTPPAYLPRPTPPRIVANREHEPPPSASDPSRSEVDFSAFMAQPFVSWLVDGVWHPCWCFDLCFSKRRNIEARPTWRFRLGGSIASTGHMFFVVWAFLIARRVEGVHQDVLYEFLITTGITSIAVSCQEIQLVKPVLSLFCKFE